MENKENPTGKVDLASTISTDSLVGTKDATNLVSATNTEDTESIRNRENDQLALRKQLQRQQRYATALIRANPGLGEMSQRIAEDLVASGLKPFEVLELIHTVYAPTDVLGRGQGERLKHFGKAVLANYGDYICSIRQNPGLVRSFLIQMSDMVNMRDEINSDLPRGRSVSFSEAILYQQVGLTADTFSDYFERLVYDGGASPGHAMIKIRDAAREVQEKNFGTLEELLFPAEMADFAWMCIKGESVGEEYNGPGFE